MYWDYYNKAEYSKTVTARRRAEVRKQKIILALSLMALIFILSIGIGTRHAFANGGGNGLKRVKYYKSVMIGCGDSISSISRDNYTSDWKDTASFIHEVSMINHLDENEELIAGNFLTIPYYTDVAGD